MPGVDDIDFSAPVPAGGYDVAPAINEKCIVFTVLLAAGYWFLPAANKFVLVALCFFPYLWLSYYDVAFGAKRNMGPTFLADFYDFAKVPNSKQILVWKNWAPKYKRQVQAVDLVLLVLIVLALPTFMKWHPKPKDDTEAAANRKSAAFFALCIASCVLCRLFLRA